MVSRMIKYSIMREQLKYADIVDIGYNADIQSEGFDFL